MPSLLVRVSPSRSGGPGFLGLAAAGLVGLLVASGCGSSKTGAGSCTTDADCSAASLCDQATSTCVAAGTSTTSSTGTGGPMNGVDQFQQRNLDDVNRYRATLHVAPLVLDPTITTFALAGAKQETMDHSAHAHFIQASNDGSIWKAGFKSSAGENQGDPNGWTVLDADPVQNELKQIDAIQLAMFNEGPGPGEPHGHYTNMMDASFHRIGIGLIEVSGALYLTNDFSD